MRQIDADTLEPDTEWDEYEDGFISYSRNQIDNATTIEPELKHGRWIQVGGTSCRCSNCDVIAFIALYPHGDKRFCPNCGAKMIGSEDND